MKNIERELSNQSGRRIHPSSQEKKLSPFARRLRSRSPQLIQDKSADNDRNRSSFEIEKAQSYARLINDASLEEIGANQGRVVHVMAQP